MAFGVLMDRAAIEIADYLKRMHTELFFRLSFGQMRNTAECAIIAAGTVVIDEGIYFDSVRHTVTNAEITAALQLQDQDGDFRPVDNGTFYPTPLTIAMIRELGSSHDPGAPATKEVPLSIKLTSWSGFGNSGAKT